MTSSDLVMEGVELMALGMGSVFAFLILLVIFTTIMSKLLGRFFPEKAPVAKAAPKLKTASASIDPQLLRVIGEAVKQHRSRRT